MTDQNKITQLIKALATMPNADENIQLVLKMAEETITAKTLTALIDNGKLNQAEPSATLHKKQGICIDFTKKEIQQMPKNFRAIYKKDGRPIYAHEHQSGKDTVTWEIRYRRQGYDISVCGKTLALVKKRFLEKLKLMPGGDKVDENGVPKTFHSFTKYYFEHYRVKKVGAETYKKDWLRYKKHLEPYFKETPIEKITLAGCQRLIDNITEEGKGKTAEEIFFLMNGIFRYAKDNHLIPYSPTDAVVHVKHETASGVALTKEEEKKLLLAVKGAKFEVCFAIALYTGIRPNEYQSIEISPKQDFIIAKNSKQKKKRNEIVYKKIPISPMLKPYIEENQNPYMYTSKHLRKIMKSILPDHILYDLRTTFYSRCKECGVDETAYKLFMGHSLKAVDRAYTDVSDEYLIKEGQKLNY